jgi:deoxyribonuclease V
MWPADVESLIARQRELADTAALPWTPQDGGIRIGGCWVCFPRGLAGRGSAGDPSWTAAVVMTGETVVDQLVSVGVAGAPYAPGLLALRTGRLMEQATRALASDPDVLLVDGTGRDHPRRAGLAVHLGAELAMPTVGITLRPLLALGDWPLDHRGATSLLRVGSDVVACWLRTQPGVRPLVVHPGWQVDLATAIDIVMSTSPRCRTPEPLRRARQAAREARARPQGPARADPDSCLG